jgi:hypothetical protein
MGPALRISAAAALSLGFAGAAFAQYGGPVVSSGPVTLGYTPAPTPRKPSRKKSAPPKTPAKARKAPPRPAPRYVQPGPCDADAKSLCAAESKDRAALHACLLKHAKSLSPRCREVSTRPLDAACRNELGLFCGGAAPGSDAARACLREHKSDDTTECLNALDDAGVGK